ncbi:MAG: hypothetical protein Q9213_005742 [Squamulea squamosa]
MLSGESWAKRQLVSSYPIQLCPDDFHFISSRCIRPRGPKAWSLVCKDTKLTAARTIYRGVCNPWQFCADIPPFLKTGEMAFCLDQAAFKTLKETSTEKWDVLRSNKGLDEGVADVEVIVTGKDVRSMLTVQSIRIWEEAINNLRLASSRRRNPPGEGHCSGCSNLKVSQFSSHLRKVDIKVQLAPGDEDAMIFLMFSDEAR